MELPSLVDINNLKIGRLDISKFTALGAPVAAIAVSFVILVFIVWPRLSEVIKLRSSNAQLSSQVGALASKVQLLSSLDKVELDSQLGLAEMILPSDKSVFSFVREVEVAAARNGVLLNKVDVVPGTLSGDSGVAVPKAGETADLAPKIQVKISVTSDYRSLLNFLANMYSVSRVIGIRDLTISSAGSSGESALALKTSMVVDAYWKPLPTQLGSIESSVESLTQEEKEILASAQAVGVTSPPAMVPSVPTGRADLFAPF